MTNRQWLAGLSDDRLGGVLAFDSCPPSISGEGDCPVDDCDKCWKDWLRAESDIPTTAIYDVVEEHKNCTVQVLKNSVTGEMSIGWKESK